MGAHLRCASRIGEGCIPNKNRKTRGRADLPLRFPSTYAVSQSWGASPCPAADANLYLAVEINHGTMFAQAIHDGLIDPSKSSQIGIRTWVDDPMCMNIFDSVAVADKSPREIVAMVKALAGDSPYYLTVDIDCLDPAFAPGTGAPVMGGVMPRELLAMLFRIVGCDVVEVAPAYDHGGIAVLAAATVVYGEVCRLARKNGAQADVYRWLGGGRYQSAKMEEQRR